MQTAKVSANKEVRRTKAEITGSTKPTVEKQQVKILHSRFVSYGKNAKQWMKKCCLLLPEIEKHRIWEKKGFTSIYEYAAKLAGMSRDKVNESLRILKKIEDKPELKKVVEEKGLLAVKPVATIATQNTAQFWAEKASKMSKHTLETYVHECRTGKMVDSGFGLNKGKTRRPGTVKDGCDMNICIGSQEEAKKTVIMELDPEIAEKLEKLKGVGDWDDLMREFLKLREEKLNQEKPEPVQTNSRHIPVKITKHVIKKTNGTCAFPGCTKPYFILHHTKRFALTYEHNPDTIIPLCKAHERMVHHSLIENEERSPEQWRVRAYPDKTHPKYLIDKIVQEKRAVR